ncbi:MAG: hypothetical protein JWQ87_3204 [Candidatus Sulfotelmatobacter sp.]|nr:hypothetical protein [Candidatus Sulfotelmatobacter sp.]
MNDLINQCQIITTSLETGSRERSQAAIDKARKLLDGLEVLCGTRRSEITTIDKNKQKAS